MKRIILLTVLFFCCSVYGKSTEWLKKENPEFTLHYTVEDEKNAVEMEAYIKEGSKKITAFFGKKFLSKIDIYIFPDRKSLDEQWQKTWAGPGYKSECWMVASGVGDRMDIVSPRVWAAEACEHNASDREEVRKIIAHELVHVLHGQYNPKHDFDGMDDLGWFIEGLATFASGQLDEQRITQAKQWLTENELPVELKTIWTGKAKYALAGTLVKYIDKKYGRASLVALLDYTEKGKILALLKITEKDLLGGWKTSLLKNKS